MTTAAKRGPGPARPPLTTLASATRQLSFRLIHSFDHVAYSLCVRHKIIQPEFDNRRLSDLARCNTKSSETKRNQSW